MVKIVIIGEAFGAEEEAANKPFIGPSGQELNRMLKDAGLRQEDIYVTNVFNLRPPKNDVAYFGAKRGEGTSTRFTKPLTANRYLKVEYEKELDRLFSELESLKPN